MNSRNHIFHAGVFSECVNQLPVWIHEVEKDRVIYKVVVICLGSRWCREVDPVRFADRFGVLIRSRETNQSGVKLRQIGRYPSRGIPRWVNRNEDREYCGSVLLFCGAGERAEMEGNAYVERTKGRHRPTHLVQLFWTDVGAIGKSKIYQSPFPQQILLSEGFVVVCEQREWAPDLGSTVSLGRKFFLCP